MVVALTVVAGGIWGFILLTKRVYKGIDHKKKELDPKKLLKHSMRSAVVMFILALITVVVFTFGFIQRIELEKENASLKRQIEACEAEDE